MNDLCTSREGAYEQVFKAKHHRTGKYFAVKISNEHNSLHHEYKIYEELSRCGFPASVRYIPTIYGFGRLGTLTWLAMDLLGPSVQQIFNRIGKFSVKTILMMAVEIMTGLQYLHDRKIVHGDIKGENFAINASDPRKIIIIDFGLASKVPSTCSEFRGSLLYASISTHQFKPACLHDDFESLAYLLVDFYKDLPWKNCQWPKKNFRDQIEFGLQQKKKKNIFEMSPEFFELTLFLMYVNVQEVPSWVFLKSIFR